MKQFSAILIGLLVLPVAAAYISQTGGTEYIRPYFTSDFEPMQRNSIPRTYPEVERPGSIDEKQNCVSYQWYRNRWWLHDYFCTDPNRHVTNSDLVTQKFYRSKPYAYWGKQRPTYNRNLITGPLRWQELHRQRGSLIYG